LHLTNLSPLALTLSAYNRKVNAVSDVEQLFTFKTNGGNGQLRRGQADAIVSAFKQVFFVYLNGVGHVLGTTPDHITTEEYNLRQSDSLFRARIALQQLTDSWLLPVGNGPGSEIKVGRSWSKALTQSQNFG
jgi:hypothetical protein